MIRRVTTSKKKLINIREQLLDRSLKHCRKSLMIIKDQAQMILMNRF